MIKDGLLKFLMIDKLVIPFVYEKENTKAITLKSYNIFIMMYFVRKIKDIYYLHQTEKKRTKFFKLF